MKAHVENLTPVVLIILHWNRLNFRTALQNHMVKRVDTNQKQIFCCLGEHQH